MRNSARCPEVRKKNVECSCGEADPAAVREIAEGRTVASIGRVDAGHCVDFRDAEYAESIIDDEEREEVDSQESCRMYFADANVEAWESEDFEDWEEDEDAVYCELRCEACNHEIELGHAPPNWQGRVWRSKVRTSIPGKHGLKVLASHSRMVGAAPAAGTGRCR